ncbi:MAG: hypothetical protein M0T86_03660 [Betaproteobacteria bacterium]|nr:hypothetical protein [Betaproteobacteria bacterium]
MTDISATPFARLDAEGRLLSPVHKGPAGKAERFGFRGEIALEFQPTLADEKRPPAIKLDQVMMVADAGTTTIPFLAGFALSLAHLPLLCDILDETLAADGQYFFFAGNLDISKKFRIPYGGTRFWVLPLDESTVYKELLDLLRMEGSDLKRLDTGGKIGAIADKAACFNETWPEISMDEALKIMDPVRIRENRPV